MKLIPILVLLAILCAPLPGEEKTLGVPVSLSVSVTTPEVEGTAPSPLFSWKITAKGRGQSQSSYRILVAEDPAELRPDGRIVWDSEKVESGQSQFVAYAGPELEKDKTYHWKVLLWDIKKEEQSWSEAQSFTLAGKSKTAAAEDGEPRALSSFQCSDDSLNEIFQAAAESRRASISGSLSFGPDKKPWSADIQLTARSFLFAQDLSQNYQDWLNQLTAGVSAESPLYPAIAPSTTGESFPAPGYSDAGIVVPFAIWQMTGDLEVVKKHYEENVAYLGALRKADPEWTGKGFGKDLGDRGHQDDATSSDFLALCFTGLDCRILIETSSAVGHMPYIMQHNAWFDFIRNGFQKRFLGEDGKLTETSQTAQILALRFSLLPPEHKQPIADALAASLKKDGLKAGIFGIGSVLPVLSWTGHHEQAVELAQGLKPDNPETAEVVLASATEWMMSFLAGINHQTPGFKTSRIAPFIPTDGSLTSVKAQHQTRYGTLSIAWETTKKGLTAEVTIPPNTNAVIVLPSEEKATLTESGKTLKDSYGCQLMRFVDGKQEIIAQSGTYKFEIVNP